jgi:hypothetical protein
MTNQHPITPPPELIAKWAGSMCGYYEAARWGADQELEACCKWLPKLPPWSADDLRKHRRPKPPSLKELALQAAQRFYANGHEDCNDEEIKDDFDTIRRALEQLDD